VLDVDVVAVQRVTDLEAQRVARAEPAGRHAAREDRVPEALAVLVHARELDSFLARVSRAVDHDLDAVELPHLPRERLRPRQTEPLQCAWPLDGEQGVVVGDVAHVGAALLALLQPAIVDVAVRRVHDQEVAVRLEPVEDRVVDDAPVARRQQGVLRVSGSELVDVVRESSLQDVASRRSLDLELAHVRDVEDPRVRAHRTMLRDHALVLDGHLPAGEPHQLRAGGEVARVERRAAQGLHAADANGAVADAAAPPEAAATQRKRRPGGEAGPS
jgi:hypothetical protein